jgi:hypothetical protein
MNLHNQIMNIQIDRVRMIDQLNFVSDYNTAYKLGHRDARHAAAELSLKAEARIEELEEVLKELYIASGPVANCAYNVGQQHEDWENIKSYIDKLDSVRLAAINVFKEKN